MTKERGTWWLLWLRVQLTILVQVMISCFRSLSLRYGSVLTLWSLLGFFCSLSAIAPLTRTLSLLNLKKKNHDKVDITTDPAILKKVIRECYICVKKSDKLDGQIPKTKFTRTQNKKKQKISIILYTLYKELNM